MNCRVRWVTFVVAAVVTICNSSNATLIAFDISPDVPVLPGGEIPGGTLIGGTYTHSNIQFNFDGGGDDINIRTARADAVGGPGVDQVVSDGFNGTQIIIKGANSYLNTPFALGDVIGDGVDEAARAPDQFSVIYDGFAPASILAGDNYIGLLLTSGNYGYLRYDYAPATQTFTFLDGAYEDTGAAVTIGAVPEPTSLVCLALAGILASVGRSRCKIG